MSRVTPSPTCFPTMNYISGGVSDAYQVTQVFAVIGVVMTVSLSIYLYCLHVWDARNDGRIVTPLVEAEVEGIVEV